MRDYTGPVWPLANGRDKKTHYPNCLTFHTQRKEVTGGSDKKNSAAPPVLVRGYQTQGLSDFYSDALTIELGNRGRKCVRILAFYQAVMSPRKPHTLAETFTHAHSLDFKNRNSWAGRG